MQPRRQGRRRVPPSPPRTPAPLPQLLRGSADRGEQAGVRTDEDLAACAASDLHLARVVQQVDAVVPTATCQRVPLTGFGVLRAQRHPPSGKAGPLGARGRALAAWHAPAVLQVLQDHALPASQAQGAISFPIVATNSRTVLTDRPQEAGARAANHTR